LCFWLSLFSCPAIAKFRKPLKERHGQLHKSAEVPAVTNEEKLRALLSTSPFTFLTHLTVNDPILDQIKQYKYQEGDHIIFKGDTSGTTTRKLVLPSLP